jgi:serine/threonine protein kinase
VVAAQDIFQLVGTTLAGKYRVDAVIGEGGFGVVYVGFHVMLGQRVAIKCMKPSSSSGNQQEWVERFLREARVLFTLTHPAVVRMYDVGTLPMQVGYSQRGWGPNVPYVVLEFLDGISLDQEIASRIAQSRGYFSKRELYQIFAPLLDGLAYAHEHGVIHRDLKPSNVMLIQTNQGLSSKVLDFGIARVVEQSHVTTENAPFTPRYAAPEQWDPNLGSITQNTDVFALGLMLIEAATFRQALPGEALGQLVVSAMNPGARLKIAPYRPDLSQELDALALHATRTQPGERVASVRVFQQHLLSMLNDGQQGGSVPISSSGYQSTPHSGSNHGQGFPSAVPTGQPNLQQSYQQPSSYSGNPHPYSASAMTGTGGYGQGQSPIATTGEASSLVLTQPKGTIDDKSLKKGVVQWSVTLIGIAAVLGATVVGGLLVASYFAYRAVVESVSAVKIPSLPSTNSEPNNPSGNSRGNGAGTGAVDPPALFPPKGIMAIQNVMDPRPHWTQGDVISIVDKHMGEIDACHERTFGKQAKPTILLDVILQGEPDGTISSIMCNGRRGKSAPNSDLMCSCISRYATTWKLRPARGSLGLLRSGSAMMSLRNK